MSAISEISKAIQTGVGVLLIRTITEKHPKKSKKSRKSPKSRGKKGKKEERKRENGAGSGH